MYTPQKEADVTFAPKITSSDLEIHWGYPAETILNQIRAFSSKPGAFAWVEIQGEKKRLKIKQAEILLMLGCSYFFYIKNILNHVLF